jgi:hypothetical protein
MHLNKKIGGTSNELNLIKKSVSDMETMIAQYAQNEHETAGTLYVSIYVYIYIFAYKCTYLYVCTYMYVCI